jgi:hypothetical protein
MKRAPLSEEEGRSATSQAGDEVVVCTGNEVAAHTAAGGTVASIDRQLRLARTMCIISHR